ncbi:MAG TPA: hypothetical protein VIG24_03410 [Acidimicrobiia bacterium]
MRFKVTSDRQPWPRGTVLGADELAGCNIEALVYGGHLTAVADKKPRKVVVETAEEPEEQE